MWATTRSELSSGLTAISGSPLPSFVATRLSYVAAEAGTASTAMSASAPRTERAHAARYSEKARPSLRCPRIPCSLKQPITSPPGPDALEDSKLDLASFWAIVLEEASFFHAREERG